jgi:hypothetical protein
MLPLASHVMEVPWSHPFVTCALTWTAEPLHEEPLYVIMETALHEYWFSNSTIMKLFTATHWPP